MPIAREALATLRPALLRYPAFPLALLATGIVVCFASDNGGVDATTWYPGALLLLGLVVVAALAVPSGRVQPLAALALAALVAYAAWSYLSIGWATQKGDAWDAANRSAVYALAFAIFALWRPRGRSAAALVGVYALAVAVIGLVSLLGAAGSSDPGSYFLSGRFAHPTGYQNANVALWFSAFWPSVALGARRELPALLRGLFVAAAVLLAGLAVLGQSRGWLFTAPVAGVVFLAVTPRRVRTTLTLALAAAATTAVVSPLLHVYDAADTRGFGGAIDHAARALLVAAAIAGAVAVAAAVWELRSPPSPVRERQAGRALGGVAVAAALAAVVALAVSIGSPSSALSRAWHDFKYTSGPAPGAGSSHLGQSLGSNRYDFWRVAWNRFEHRPLTGIGADNYQEAYLARRKSFEEPRYPHSIELRTLSQTGVVGAVLLVLALWAGLTAGVRAVRRRQGLGAVAAAGALTSFAYWFLHGSVDWFYEVPALGAAAFALLGLAAGLAPPRPDRRPGRRRPLLAGPAAAAAAVAIVPAASFAAPWVAKLESNSAVSVWARDPSLAYRRLDRAADLNPLSPEPKQLAGAIAVRLRQPARAESYFRDAIDRDAGDSFSRLELGALLAQRGQRRAAVALLRRAVALDPRDDVTRGVLRRVHRRRPVNIDAVNAELARRSEELAR